VHRYHPNPELKDDPEAVLYDNCEDCMRHARHLGLTLDDSNWMNMWDRMLAVEATTGDTTYRSQTEAKLGEQMYHMYVALERYTAIDPKTLFAPWKLV
jgi:hypothetical protein